MKTLNDLKKEAIDAQDACNIIALARRFAEVLLDLRELGVKGSDELREHPVVVLWVNKLDSLVGSDAKYYDAYTACTEDYQNAERS